jgi:hypothetical protein
MKVFWKIRYLDRANKQFKDRFLRLHTKTLDPVTRAAVELTVENKSSRTEREILKYRCLFTEGSLETAPGNPDEWDEVYGIFVIEYFEDEAGREITPDEMAQIMTGSPTARHIPSGFQQHDIDLMFAQPKPVPLAEVSLAPDEVRLLGYFVRDHQEMQHSAFMKDGPGELWTSGVPALRTAVTDDEIRSFVTIFRRLYMTGHHDPASFVKIVRIFVKALGDHPCAKWAEDAAKAYERRLATPPENLPSIPAGTFTTKRLIDVFLYTQYVHQPNEERQRQFEACLAELSGKRAVLFWLFLTEMQKCAMEIGNVGNVIAWWFGTYCQHHGVSPDVLNSLRDDHAGLGAGEKEADKQERLFRQKVEQLAADLWEQASRPAGGPSQFLAAARDQLSRTLQR